ncbi:MAG: HEAT repeat domain-containing protein [Kiritimatiellae bacterium]|nr:HEAT repeat domain-containing protein [Kiritimatiellia bacterium]
MNRKWTHLAIGGVIMGWLMSASGQTPTRVGIFIDGRSGDMTGLTATLRQEGMTATNIAAKDLCNPAKLQELDVLFFPGGWNASQFLNFEARKAAVDFVARGKGILACAFRGGYVRTINRPLFPEVGVGYNRVSANYVFARDGHALMKGVSTPWCHPAWDHIVMKVGPQGTAFLTDVSDDPVGICGEPRHGRYVAVGLFLGGGKEPLQGNEKVFFLNCIRWLASAKPLAGNELAQSRAAAELAFLRQERIWDYTLYERGPDNGPGLIPAERDMIQTELEMWAIRLDAQKQWLAETERKQLDPVAAQLKSALEKLGRNFNALVEARIKEINGMTSEALLKDDPKAYAQDLLERLLPRKEIDAVVQAAEKAHAQFAARVKQARDVRARDEHERDLKMVPDLISQCASTSLEEKRRAALELGRIGDARGEKVLITLLADADQEVRRNAIHGLGWLQATAAVPELVKLAEGKDQWARRRATQALGQIGDKAAVATLVKLIGHPDNYTAINAILALGWLGEGQATPALLDVVAKADRNDLDGNDKVVSAITALGHIGDKAALPILEQVAQSRKTEVKYRYELSIDYIAAAQSAILEINAGGRKQCGIKQPGYLTGRDNFYGLRDKLNFFVGRPALALKVFPQFKKYPEAFIDYMQSGGATAFLSGWGDNDLDPAQTELCLKAANERDMKWIMDLPMVSSTNRINSKIQKASCEAKILRHQAQPAFGGMWREEVYPAVTPSTAEFEAFLKEKYGADYRARLGLDAAEKIEVPANDQRLAHKRLWTEYLDLAGRCVIEDWQEAQEWMHGLRKGCTFAFSISSPGCMSHALGIYPKAGGVIDLHGPEAYASHGRDLAFMMELARDGETRPVLCEFYNWYSPNTAWAERGYALHLMHGESFFNFYIGQIFKQASASYALWSWDSDRWAAAERVFLKARKIGAYLGKTASAANVALIYSDRSSQLFYSKSIEDRSGRERRYYQHQAGLWQAFQQAHIPLDSIWAETMTAEKLARYKAVVLSDAKSLAPAEVELLREWVRNGGVLLASGTTTLFNEWGEPEKNYRLADVFGVDYAAHHAITDPVKSDSYCFIDSARSCEKIFNEGLDPDKIRNFVQREVKPVKSLTTLKLVKSDFPLTGVAADLACEYDFALGYDGVMPGKATVIAQWPNGGPAITVNRFGKGTCLFWSEIYPGFSYTCSGWEMHPLYRQFWPGVQELMAALITSGLKQNGVELPVTVEGCPDQVEVTIRTQPENRRWMIHFLNFDPKLASVKGFRVTIRPPAVDKLKLFYPDDGREIKFRQQDQAVTFDTREFGIHDMAVISY